MTILQADRLSITFGGVRAIDGVSVAIAAGQVFSIIGPNGSGKTTLLNLVSGHLHAAGRQHQARRRNRDGLCARPTRASRTVADVSKPADFFPHVGAGKCHGRPPPPRAHRGSGRPAALALGRAPERGDPRGGARGAGTRGPRRCGGAPGRLTRLWRAQTPGNRARARQRTESAAARRAGRRLQSGRDPGNRSRHPFHRQARDHGRAGRA